MARGGQPPVEDEEGDGHTDCRQPRHHQGDEALLEQLGQRFDVAGHAGHDPPRHLPLVEVEPEPAEMGEDLEPQRIEQTLGEPARPAGTGPQRPPVGQCHEGEGGAGHHQQPPGGRPAHRRRPRLGPGQGRPGRQWRPGPPARRPPPALAARAARTGRAGSSGSGAEAAAGRSRARRWRAGEPPPGRRGTRRPPSPPSSSPPGPCRRPGPGPVPGRRAGLGGARQHRGGDAAGAGPGAPRRLEPADASAPVSSSR